ncbi:MAG: hypothetical protein ACTSRB_18295, partial [Candidatus Helarchaeota archaeon]
VRINEFTSDQLHDAFLLSEEFMKIQSESDPSVYPTINQNYLRPAAASIVHPHLQVLAIPECPPPILAQAFHFGVKYRQEYGSDFFTDYIQAEKKAKLRWLGTLGNGASAFSFMASWCPLAGRDEVTFISHQKSSVPLGTNAWKNVAEGLVRIYKGYHEMGVRSFNMVIFSDRWASKEHSDDFRVFGMLWSRPLRNLDCSDFGFAEVGYKMALAYTPPEIYAKILKKYW